MTSSRVRKSIRHPQEQLALDPSPTQFLFFWMLEYDWLTLDRVTGTTATGMLEQQLLSTLTARCRAGSHLTAGSWRSLCTQVWPGSRSGPSEGLKQRGRARTDTGRSLGVDPPSVNTPNMEVKGHCASGTFLDHRDKWCVRGCTASAALAHQDFFSFHVCFLLTDSASSFSSSFSPGVLGLGCRPLRGRLLPPAAPPTDHAS